MDKHPCIESLQRGCYEEHIPVACAKELIHYLLVKKCYQDETRNDMQCSSLLNKLQLWLLLETDTREEVENLIGKIRHTQDKSYQGNASGKRLLAMERMAAEGWAPDVALWEEPGTESERIITITLRLTGVKERELTTYAYEGMNCDVQASSFLYNLGYRFDEIEREDTSEQESSNKRKRDEGVAAGRMYYTAHCSPLTIFCKTLTARTLMLVVEREHNTVLQLKQLIYANEGIPPVQQRLILGGKELADGRTVSHYRIQNESVLHLILRLGGC